MSPLFRLRSGNAVYSCRCGCDGAVEVTPEQEYENVGRGYYIRHHAHLGAAPECLGPRYEFSAETQQDALETVQVNLDVWAPPVAEKINIALPAASYAEDGAWYDAWPNEITPVVKAGSPPKPATLQKAGVVQPGGTSN